MSATLLLADDSITIQRVIELTFADEDVRVVVAGDGQQAIQKIDADPPDIILADIGMPRVDGYEVAAYVKRAPALKHIPVLLLTGAFEPIDEARARQTGCDGVLVKPFEPQTLVARVKELLAGGQTGELWPADMPRTAPRPARAVPPPPVFETPAPALSAPPTPIEIRRMPEVLQAEQPQVASPPLSVPVTQPEPMAPVNSGFDLSNVEVAPPVVSAAPEGEDVANRAGDFDLRQSRPELPPPADRLESELDMLDAALSRLDPTAHPNELDEATASDFARDLNALRGEQRPDDETPGYAGRPSFGSWDLPNPGGNGADHAAPVDLVAEEIHVHAPAPPPHAPVVAAPPVAEPPAPQPVVETPAPAPVVAAAPSAPPAPAPAAAAAPERPTLAAAFGALLAAERAQPPAKAGAPSARLSDAAIEQVVRRVLARMTDDTVKAVVLETAERLIREEISRTKGSSGH